MVGGKNRKVPGPKRGFELRQPGVQAFERGAIAFDIVAMAILLVEIDQVDEDEAVLLFAHRFESLRHAVGIVFGFARTEETAPEEDVEDLTDALGGHAAGFE